MIFEKSKSAVITATEMREIENEAIKNGISESFMMEEAGKNSAGVIRKILSQSETQNLAFVIGKNNNGGDGIVAAGVLTNDFGIKCDLFFFADSYSQLGALSRQKYDKYVVGNGKIEGYFNDFSKLAKGGYTAIVDALFGIGFKGAMRDDAKQLVKIVNSLKANSVSVISLDIPSGIDDGYIEASCKDAVNADITIAMGALKEVNVAKPAKFCNGELIAVGIGVDKSFFELKARGWYINNKIIELQEKATWKSHKYQKGKTLIIAGSKGMSGAAVLATKAALKLSGAVRCAVPESIWLSMETNLIEAVKIYCNDNGRGVFGEDCFEQIKEQLVWADSVLIGPGIKREPETEKLVKKVLQFVQKGLKDKDIILDADALAVIDTQFLKEIKSENNNIIITPHEGEFERLFESEKIDRAFSEKAKMLKRVANEFGIAIVLKGPDTYAVVPKGSPHMINFADNYVAKAGAGDVLSGIIASVCSVSSSSLEEKLCVSVAIHSYAAERAAIVESRQTMLPTDIIEHIKEYFLEMKGAIVYA